MEHSKTIMLPGPAGNIETIIDQPITTTKLIGIVCHPHPLHGGTMNNKVVTTVTKSFQRLDIISVRFNFRGVGKSEGEYGNIVGELDDLRAVISWVRKEYPDYKLLLAGFSFGSYIAAKVATEIAAEALVTVAPPVHYDGFANLPPIEIPWILIQGEADEVVSANQVFDWVDHLPIKPELIRLKDVGHFFHGALIELRDIIVEFLKVQLSNQIK